MATGDIRAAWYVAPTNRYGHAVLGDAIEAAGLAITDASGQEYRVELPSNAVFEDLTPRLVDLDGDGRTEIITIRSTQRGGGAIAVYGLRDGSLTEIAAIPPIGRSNRWLNPAGIADFDGDGRQEIALVKTPHIGGTLEFWGFDGSQLTLKASAFGFSNHAIGARALDLSAVVDVNGDDRPDLILPDAARQEFRAVTLDGGKVRVLATALAPGGIGGNITVQKIAEGFVITYPPVRGDGKASVTLLP